MKVTSVPSAGHGEYAYQQSTYGEQAYDRSFEEPSQHFFEGGNSKLSRLLHRFSPSRRASNPDLTGSTCVFPGNSQYSQQQSHFQQSSGQQQQQQPAYGQQPYPSPQGYAGQQHSYGQSPKYKVLHNLWPHIWKYISVFYSINKWCHSVAVSMPNCHLGGNQALSFSF